jgi:DNA-binding GntR family transcriptional regulator
MTDEDFGLLSDALVAMDRLGDERDFEGWTVPHREFHRLLVHRSGPRLVRQLSELSDHSERYRRINLEQPIAWARGAEEHQAIFESCRERDAPGAANRLAAHLSKTALTVIAVVDPAHDPSAVRDALRFARQPEPGAGTTADPFNRGRTQ